MRRLAILVVIASCWSGKASERTLENRSAERDLTAAYFCSIEEGGYKYQSYPCAVRKIDGRWMLAKLAGSQRFRGEIHPANGGFTFDGEYYCPWGDCTQPLHGMFKAAGDGSLRGTFRDAPMIVTLVPAPDSAFGGASYGGDSYGGFGYGGLGYGGTPPPHRGNRRR